MLTDTHCHLNFDSFDADRQEVLQRARLVGVGRILNPGVDLSSSRAALDLARAVPEVFAAIGVHPNDAAGWEEHSAAILHDMAGHPKVVAIGEIGLDYYRDRTPRQRQRQVFRQQLALAAALGLPVVIHLRNRSMEDRLAAADMLDILIRWQEELALAGSALVDRAGVLHSFSDNLACATRAVQLGFFIGVTGPVTYRKAEELQEVVAGIPADRLLVETDAPFLPPQPYRGQRNEPAYVVKVIEKVAELRGVTKEEMARITTQNAERLFHWQVMR